MKVSIIIPVYNVEKFLKECLESLIHQTLEDIEIICINDCSTDNSLEILNEYAKKDSRITVITQENGGVSIARNRGLDIAKGEYIGLVDSDDYIDLDFYEKLYNSAKENNADIAAASIIKFGKNKSRNFLTFDTQTISTDFKETCSLLNIPDKTYVWNKIYLREKLNKYNLRFKGGICYEDLVFTPLVLEKLEKVVTVPGIRYYYRKNKNSLVHQKTAKHKKDYQDSHNFAVELLKKHGIDIGEKKYKIFGITVFKKIIKIDRIIYILFNFIRFSKAR